MRRIGGSARRGLLAGFAAAALALVVAPTQSAFGAVSDQGTPCVQPCTVVSPTSGGNSAPTIQAAIDASAPGSTVLQNPGGYLLSQPIRVRTGVRLLGSGVDVTTLKLDRANWPKFSYGYMVTPDATATGVTVANLTIDGSRADSIAAGITPAANTGGAVKLGSGWTVSNLRLTNANYFRIWLKDVSAVTVRDCTFDDRGGSGSGNDLIGGGGVSGATITNNRVEASASGNALDLLRSRGITYSGNIVDGSASKPHNLYLEGVTDSTVSANTLRGSSVSVQSDSGYASTVSATNPVRISVLGNTISGTAVHAIAIRYDTHPGGQTIGGGNLVADNSITTPGTAGVLVHSAAIGLATADTIRGNTITEPFASAKTEWNTGYGVAPSAGIIIGFGQGTSVTGNRVNDTLSQGLVTTGIAVGIRNSRGVTPTLSNTSGNSVSGDLKTVFNVVIK